MKIERADGWYDLAYLSIDGRKYKLVATDHHRRASDDADGIAALAAKLEAAEQELQVERERRELADGYHDKAEEELKLAEAQIKRLEEACAMVAPILDAVDAWRITYGSAEHLHAIAKATERAAREDERYVDKLDIIRACRDRAVLEGK